MKEQQRFPVYDWTPYPTRDRPAEYCGGGYGFPKGWHKDGRPVRVKKKNYHFIWPRDGKNTSKWGRFKDIMTGQGPDIHVTISARRNDKMHNRQRKSVWSNHRELDDRDFDDLQGKLEVPWAKRDETEGYDFLTRKYRKKDKFMMTDAVWKDGWPKNHGAWPYAFRNIYGDWLEHNPWRAQGILEDMLEAKRRPWDPRDPLGTTGSWGS